MWNNDRNENDIKPADKVIDMKVNFDVKMRELSGVKVRDIAAFLLLSALGELARKWRKNRLKWAIKTSWDPEKYSLISHDKFRL